MSALEVRGSPRLGCVKYLNAQPLIRGWEGAVHFDHPSALCQMLARGDLDVALVSSFEYLRHPVYSIVDGVAIASDGPVYSVFLAHYDELENLREVVVDPASDTSINLLRCLLGARGLALEFVAQGQLGPARGTLLIGDQAIQFRRRTEQQIQLLDLGAAWKELTALPFVFALWLIHPDWREKKEIATKLRSLAKKNLARLEDIIEAQPEKNRTFAEFYFRDCLRFSFRDREKAGFLRFAQLCVGQKLLTAIPNLTALV